MPKIQPAAPDTLRPYIFHGIDMHWRPTDKQALGDCPWCGGERKFDVNIATGVWHCHRCNTGVENGKTNKGGNVATFLSMLWEKSHGNTQKKDWEQLALDRSYPDWEPLLHWGLARSILTPNWLVPGYDAGGKLTGLYQYLYRGGRMLLMPTPTLGHHLLGRNLYSDSKPIVYLCEGIWDAIAIWLALRATKEIENEDLVLTSNEESSLLSEANVLAIPTYQSFSENWLPLFADKIVNLVCQNDHDKAVCAACKKAYSPHESTVCLKCGNAERLPDLLPSASYVGMERIARLMSGYGGGAPTEINFIRWGAETYNSALPSGYDPRDFLVKA